MDSERRVDPVALDVSSLPGGNEDLPAGWVSRNPIFRLRAGRLTPGGGFSTGKSVWISLAGLRAAPFRSLAR